MLQVRTVREGLKKIKKSVCFKGEWGSKLVHFPHYFFIASKWSETCKKGPEAKIKKIPHFLKLFFNPFSYQHMCSGGGQPGVRVPGEAAE